MDNSLLQLIMSVLGAVGFAIYFNIDKSKIIPAALGGFLSWVIYLIIDSSIHSMFIASFIALICVTLYAEVMAILLKTPTNVIIIPAAIPVLPGSAFYYTMVSVVTSNGPQFQHYGNQTIQVVLGVVLGIAIGYFIWEQSAKILKTSRKYGRKLIKKH